MRRHGGEEKGHALKEEPAVTLPCRSHPYWRPKSTAPDEDSLGEEISAWPRSMSEASGGLSRVGVVVRRRPHGRDPSIRVIAPGIRPSWRGGVRAGGLVPRAEALGLKRTG